MDRNAARARLERMVHPKEKPTLTADDLEDLLDLARRPDANGALPDDTGWAGAYDLNAAAAEGYRRKAGKVAGKGDFAADGASFQRSSLSKQLLDQAKVYQARSDEAAGAGAVSGAIGSIRVRSPWDDGGDLADDEGWPWPGVPVANL